MQPGHEELSLAPEELSPAPELEELLDVSNTSAQEMRVRLKKGISIISRDVLMKYFCLFPKQQDTVYCQEDFHFPIQDFLDLGVIPYL